MALSSKAPVRKAGRFTMGGKTAPVTDVQNNPIGKVGIALDRNGVEHLVLETGSGQQGIALTVVGAALAAGILPAEQVVNVIAEGGKASVTALAKAVEKAQGQ